MQYSTGLLAERQQQRKSWLNGEDWWMTLSHLVESFFLCWFTFAKMNTWRSWWWWWWRRRCCCYSRIILRASNRASMMREDLTVKMIVSSKCFIISTLMRFQRELNIFHFIKANERERTKEKWNCFELINSCCWHITGSRSSWRFCFFNFQSTMILHSAKVRRAVAKAGKGRFRSENGVIDIRYFRHISESLSVPSTLLHCTLRFFHFITPPTDYSNSHFVPLLRRQHHQ